MKNAIVWFIVIILSVSVCAFAQGGGNAAITGTVTDPTGAIIPGAKVTVTQQGTSAKRLTQTNTSGHFSVPSLLPASYSVSVEASGFKTYKTELTLLADEARAMNVQLQVGQTTQSITVEAASVKINTVTPVLSQVVEQSRVVDLPLNGRNAADLTLLVPGTTGANGHGTTQGTTKQVPGAESISVNGARPNQISYNLDGASNEDLMSNTNNPFPFPDAVQEFSVQTNSFDAQYGTNAGAVLNVVTKSGTNLYHGDVFEFVRNKSFIARNAFSPERDPLKRNQFGVTLGGPVTLPGIYNGKDKSWFFFGYQGTRIRTSATGQTATLPTPAELNGDFSAFLDANNPANVKKKVIQINNPDTGMPFSGNIIPQSDISPVALNMTQFLPIGQEAVDGRVIFSRPSPQNFNSYTGRFDQVLRGQDRLFVRAQIDRFTAAPPFDGKDLLTIGAGSIVLAKNYAVGYTSIISPNQVNNFTASYVRTASDRGQGGQVPQMGEFGVNIFQLPKAEGGIRGFGVSGFFGFGTFNDAKFIRNNWDIRDQFTWTRGKHTFGFGGEWERLQSNIRNTDLENGTFNFSDDTTNLALASFVLGHLRSFSQTSGDFSDSRQNVWGTYVSDKWKFRPHLSFDLGLRWEPQVPMKEIRGRIEQFFPDAFAAGTSSSVIPSAPPGLFFKGDSFGGVEVPPGGAAGDFNNFAPRWGFAWNPGGGKTVVRGGGGIFYQTRLSGLFLNDASISQPFSLRIDLTEGPGELGPFSDPLEFNQAFAQGFPQRFILDAVPPDVPFNPPVQVFGLQPGRKFVTPRTYQWNMTVERQLRSDTIFRVSYVGLRSKHLREDVNLNPAQYIPGDSAFNSLSTDSRRIFPGFSDIRQSQNDGSSSFNALEATVEKRPGPGANRFWRNLTLLANYTYSKSMDIALAEAGGITDIGSSKGAGVPYTFPFSGAFETGPSDFDHTHSFVGSWTWAFPSMANAPSPLTRWFLGGWQATGIFTARSGTALTITAGFDQSKTNQGEDRAQFIGPLSDLGQVVDESQRSGCAASGFCKPFLDTSEFITSKQDKSLTGTFGNIGKGRFRGPSRWNADMGFFKNFYPKGIGPMKNDESFRVQIRTEFFNIFNHTEFNDPTTNFSSSTFGGIRGAAGPRIIQLALKLFF